MARRSVSAASGHLLAEVLEDRAAGVDALVLLGVVAGHDVVAEAVAALVGGPLPRQHPQEAGLAGAVEAHDQQPLAPLEGEVDVAEHLEVAVADGEPLALEHQPAGLRRRREPDVDGARGAGGLDLAVLEAHDALLDAVGHGRLGGLGAEAVDERLEAVDLLGLALRRLGQPDLVLGAGVEVLGVGALVLLDGADAGVVVALEVQDAGDGLVEQVEVVADHEQRAPVGAHEAEQPLLGVAVEVVGGLVEEQEVAAGEQDPGDLHPAPLAARQRTDRQVEAVALEPEAGGDPAHLALGRVAAVDPELLLRPGEAGDRPLRRVLLHLDPQLLDPDHGLVEPAAGEDVADGGGGVVDAVEPGVLREVAEPAGAVDDARRTGRRRRPAP